MYAPRTPCADAITTKGCGLDSSRRTRSAMATRTHPHRARSARPASSSYHRICGNLVQNTTKTTQKEKENGPQQSSRSSHHTTCHHVQHTPQPAAHHTTTSFAACRTVQTSRSSCSSHQTVDCYVRKRKETPAIRIAHQTVQSLSTRTHGAKGCRSHSQLA